MYQIKRIADLKKCTQSIKYTKFTILINFKMYRLKKVLNVWKFKNLWKF